MTFDPPDAYAGQQAARDNGELYRYAAEQSRRVGASAAQQD